MEPEQEFNFLTRVYDATIRGTLEWRETADKEAFLAAYPAGSLIVMSDDSYVSLSLFNQTGNRIANILKLKANRNDTLGLLRKLLDLARNQALKIDEEITDFFEYLDDPDGYEGSSSSSQSSSPEED